MNTLLRARTIRSIREVRGPVRPHPDFGMTEIRIFHRVPVRQPVAQRLGSAEELDALSEVLERGASDERQRSGAATSGGVTDVADALITDFAGDRLARPGEGRYAGH